MNLVSYEFVACQASKKGVLILSEVGSSLFIYGFDFTNNIFGILDRYAYDLFSPFELDFRVDIGARLFSQHGIRTRLILDVGLPNVGSHTLCCSTLQTASLEHGGKG